MTVLALDLIDPAPRNANVMDATMLAVLTAALKEAHARGEDLRQPILVRPKADGVRHEIVDGHHRVAAAQAAGFDTVPVVIRQMTDDEAARTAIAMNKIRGELNLGVVGEIFADLAGQGVMPEELATTGFSADEVDSLIRAALEHPDDELPPDMEGQASKPKPGAAPETWELEVSFADRKDRDRVRRTARKLGGGDPATGLLRLVEAEQGEGDLEQLLAAAELTCSASATANAGDYEGLHVEELRRVVSRVSKHRAKKEKE